MAQSGSLEVADFWDGNPAPVSGSTPFGYFDDDPEFQNEAPKICNFIAKKLGYPAQDIELTDEQMYADIELAMMQYSELLNEFKTEENYMDLLGAPTGSSLSDKLIYPNMNSVIRLADKYAVEANTGGTLHSGSIQIKRGQQVYNLQNEYFGVEHSGEGDFTIREVFHNRKPSSSATGYGSFVGEAGAGGAIPHFDFGNSYSGYYTLMPMSYNVMRTQAIDMAREIRQSEYGFEINNNVFRIFPVPSRDFRLWFTYTMDQEQQYKGDDQDSIYGRDDLINDPSKVNFEMRQWSDINKKDRIWIIKYSLALSKITLGLVRRKYSDYPYPSGTVSLDGSELVSEGISETEGLNQEMKDYFDELSTERGMEKKLNINNSMREIQNNVPLGIYKI